MSMERVWNDAFAIFEDLCSLGNDVRPQFLQLECLHKAFTLGPIENVLTNYHELFCEARVSSSFRTKLAVLHHYCHVHSTWNLALLTTQPLPATSRTAF